MIIILKAKYLRTKKKLKESLLKNRRINLKESIVKQVYHIIFQVYKQRVS